MKKIYLLAILAMGASSVFGHGKLDLRSLSGFSRRAVRA